MEHSRSTCLLMLAALLAFDQVSPISAYSLSLKQYASTMAAKCPKLIRDSFFGLSKPDQGLRRYCTPILGCIDVLPDFERPKGPEELQASFVISSPVNCIKVPQSINLCDKIPGSTCPFDRDLLRGSPLTRAVAR